MHGNVFRAGSSSAAGEVALKVHLRRDPFEQALETYLRLREAMVTQVLGFNVPQLLGYDAELWVLEMTVVQQPFVLDFAEVRLDFPLEFPDEVWTTWLEEKREQFGERWPVVERVLGEFEAGYLPVELHPHGKCPGNPRMGSYLVQLGAGGDHRLTSIKY